MRNIQWIVFHRFTLGAVTGYDNTPEDWRRFFREHPEGRAATGGRFPYHWVIDKAGQLHVMVNEDIATPHAGRYNAHSVAIAVIGDFRKGTPLFPQLTASQMLASILLARYPDAEIMGHTTLPGATNYRGHVCPGDLFPLVTVREFAKLGAQALYADGLAAA